MFTPYTNTGKFDPYSFIVGYPWTDRTCSRITTVYLVIIFQICTFYWLELRYQTLFNYSNIEFPSRKSPREMERCRCYLFIITLFIQIYLKSVPVSFPCGLLHDIYKKKSYPFMVHPLLPVPGCIVTWAWSLAKGQYMVSWLLTGAPEQRYWQNNRCLELTWNRVHTLMCLSSFLHAYTNNIIRIRVWV